VWQFVAHRLAVTVGLLLWRSLAWAGPTLHIENQTACLDNGGLQSRLGQILEEYGAAENAIVSVTANPGDLGTTVNPRDLGTTVNRGDIGTIATLRVVTITGEVVMERRFDIVPESCPSAIELIAAVLQSFLREFPREKWQEEPLPKVPPEVREIVIENDVTQYKASVFTAVDSRWPKPSASLDAGVLIDVGGRRHGLVSSAAIRLGMPHGLGAGHFIETFFLLGVGWRYQGENWLLNLALRVGPLMVSGIGFANNYRNWLFYAEAQGTWLFAWRGIHIGPELAVAPLINQVETTRRETTTLPWMRLGCVVVIPIWSKKM